jgi:hypothetical protein
MIGVRTVMALRRCVCGCAAAIERLGVDIDKSAAHERSFGLWRADGSPKPAVAEVTARAGSLRVPPPSPEEWLDIDQDTFASDRQLHLARLYRRYRGIDGP